MIVTNIAAKNAIKRQFNQILDTKKDSERIPNLFSVLFLKLISHQFVKRHQHQQYVHLHEQ